MKTSTMVAIFAIGLVYGMFAIIHAEAPSVKTAGGYDFWFYSGIAAIVIAAITGLAGFAGQSKRK